LSQNIRGRKLSLTLFCTKEYTPIKAILVGRPNVGKSSLINTIAKRARLKIGNFNGVTVKKAEIDFKYFYSKSNENFKINIIDLPGLYSLTHTNAQEKITQEYLDNNTYDVIVNVVDSTHLQRDLALSAELLEMGKKVVVVLNMIDETNKQKVEIDEQLLSQLLGTVCIKTSATKKIGMEELKKAIVQVHKQERRPSKVYYSKALEKEIHTISDFVVFFGFDTSNTPREFAIRLLKDHNEVENSSLSSSMKPLLDDAKAKLLGDYEDMDELFSDEYLAFAKSIKAKIIKIAKPSSINITQRIDQVFMNRVTGIPIFMFFMWSIFQLTFEVGGILMEYLDRFFALMGEVVVANLGNSTLGDIISNGIMAGVGSVVILFIPNILILFIGIALLETTGYMSRVAFLLDGFFHRFGLHGRSFIPLVTGFGCSVPAYMAVRTLKNEKDRLLTLFIIGFMSCGARLPIYVLFVGAFFAPSQAGNMLFLIYFGGALLGLMAAKVLHIFVFKGEAEPFIMEMPKYRMPSLKLITYNVYSHIVLFLKKAGTFILLASIVIWFASHYPKNEALEQSYQIEIEQAPNDEAKAQLENRLKQKLLEQSYLGVIGKVSEPLVAPLGMDWKMAVALETGLAAKEMVVSTLGILYAIGDDMDEESQTLQAKLAQHISFPAAMAFIVFVMIYLPCLAASMVFVREAGSWRYLAYLFVFTTATAWILSFITYRVLSMLTSI
jgi:ferrous iron transport protein B